MPEHSSQPIGRPFSIMPHRQKRPATVHLGQMSETRCKGTHQKRRKTFTKSLQNAQIHSNNASLGDEESLHSFMLSLNDKQWGIRFTYEYIRSSVNFLDLVIFKDQGQLLTKHFSNLQTKINTFQQTAVITRIGLGP